MVKTFTLSQEERNIALEGVSARLSREERILFAYAYGSFLQDAPFRDLDIAVYLYPETSKVLPFRFEDALSQTLTEKLNLSFPVDVRILNGASVSFRYHVFQGRLLFEKDADARIEMVTHTVARYLDLSPFLHHYLKEAHGCET